MHLKIHSLLVLIRVNNYIQAMGWGPIGLKYDKNKNSYISDCAYFFKLYGGN